MVLSRAECQDLDAKDPLREFRDEFSLPPGVVYLLGNSLGALPRRTPERVAHTVETEWGCISGRAGTRPAGGTCRRAPATASRP